MPATTVKTWDIFCRVIDNYGDIGVCWRLARQLANEHHQEVRLWVDELEALIRLWPEARDLDQQSLAGVEVRRWPRDFPADVRLAERVIEAFACDIPAPYLAQMAQAKHAGKPPVWVNLDYLSAESWVEDCHSMVSVHPATGLRKRFFFPGFSPKTGGLLRERGLIAARDATDSRALLAQLGINPAPDSLIISLFAYENPAIGSLINAWTSASRPIHCLVPEGKILTSINQVLAGTLSQGDIYTRGTLSLQVIPFVNQGQYDQLLWACDINLVRGEDSFIRAQWAGKPMLWHIYPQEQDAHLVKLEAFLARYTDSTPEPLKTLLRQSWLAWNQAGDMSASWPELMAQLTIWQQHSRQWCDSLVKQDDLASQLVAHCSQEPG